MKGISRSFLYLLPLALLAGCPDSSAPDVQGTWEVAVTQQSGNSVSAIAAVLAGGPGFMYTEDGDIYFFATPLTDQRSVSGDLLHFDLADCEPAPSLCFAEPDTYAGTAYGDHIGLSLTRPLVTDGTGPTTASSTAELNRSDPLSGVVIGRLQDLDTQWQGYYLPSNTAVTVTNEGDGAITGSDGFGCSFTGSIDAAGGATTQGNSTQTTEGLDKVTLAGVYDKFHRRCDATVTGAGYFSATGIGPFKGVPGLYFLTGVGLDLNGYMLEFKVK